MRNQRGITLIALVITIIVLLILAGVSIAMLTGQNGILTRAQDATKATTEAEADEALRLAVSEILTNKLDPTYANEAGEPDRSIIDEDNIEALVTGNNSNVTATCSTAITGDDTKSYIPVKLKINNSDEITRWVEVESGKIVTSNPDTTE